MGGIIIFLILLFIFGWSLLIFILATKYLREVKIIHNDINEFRDELIKLASQRKRRF